jgi:hypothetical protein
MRLDFLPFPPFQLPALSKPLRGFAVGYALVTSVNLCNLISCSSAPPELFVAYGAIVCQMQPQTRGLAYHAIACELDWPHRDMIWALAGLSAADRPRYKCAFEQ